jgi:stage IV sporulation protein FB
MRIGRLWGCRLRIHLLVFPVVAAMAWLGQLPTFLMTLAMLIIHELCHVAVARMFGFHVGEIELLPVGCVARIDGLFAMDPRAETAIALAGPLSNLLLVMLLTTLDRYALVTGPVVQRLISINLTLALFNLMPGLPLDGGRAVRATLAREMGLVRATVIASWMGFGCGAILAAWGAALLVRGTPAYLPAAAGALLMLLSLRERRTAAWLMLREASDKKDILRRSEVLPVRQIVADASLPLGRLVRRFVPHRYHMVLVVNEQCAPLGSLSESQVMDAIMNRGMMEEVGALLPRARARM